MAHFEVLPIMRDTAAPAEYIWWLKDDAGTMGAAYCCGPCIDAWEASPRYEPHANTPDCDGRHVERGPIDPWERP